MLELKTTDGRTLRLNAADIDYFETASYNQQGIIARVHQGQHRWVVNTGPGNLLPFVEGAGAIVKRLGNENKNGTYVVVGNIVGMVSNATDADKTTVYFRSGAELHVGLPIGNVEQLLFGA